MNKNVVLYASVHHHNTQRVAMQLAKDLQADIHDVLKDPSISIASYDTIILASGIYYGGLHEKIHDHIMKQEWKGKKVIIFIPAAFIIKITHDLPSGSCRNAVQCMPGQSGAEDGILSDRSKSSRALHGNILLYLITNGSKIRSSS